VSSKLGQQLRELREAQGLDLAALSRRTRIPERQLKRLERGELRELPAMPYVRGFVRAYVQSLGGEPAPFLVELSLLSAAVAVDVEGPAAAVAVARGSEPSSPPPKALPSPHVDPPPHGMAPAPEGPTVEVALLVVLLAILATLTVSLLLRHPAPTDEGISLVAPVRLVPAHCPSAPPSRPT
jgi:hypothetical protein